jgi:very-short-patch-repair endonuclease
MKIPKALSFGEEVFDLHCQIQKIAVTREYQFFSGRKWRADFMIAGNGTKLLVEIEGGTSFGNSRHSKGNGFENDCRKYNKAALMGYTVLRFTTAMVGTGEAIDLVLQALDRESIA